VETCPDGAVNLEGEPEEISVSADAVVIAGGYQAFDPNEKPRFGYGRVPGVITALELDSMLRMNNFSPAGPNGDVHSAAFIQCVGSRDVRLGRNYCSTVCCGYALRMARLLRHRFPGFEPSMFYMDIQTFDRDFEARLKAAAEEVRLIRAIPSEIRRGDDDRPVLVFQSEDTERFVESYDLVVLSIGISPSKSSGMLSGLFGVEMNEDGFLGRGGEDVATNVEGVFLAGTIQGPGSIEHSVSHSIRAAGETASYLDSRRA
jgi:heterodisulfide reductase subunit A